MKKVLIAAAVAVVAMGCSKRAWDTETPTVVDRSAPIGFHGGTSVEVTPAANRALTKAPVDVNTLGVNLGVFAFTGASLPANDGATSGLIWDNATNLEYSWQSDKFAQAVPSLFWPSSGSSTQLSFASYFPHSTSVAAHKLTADFKDQKATPNYAYAWAKLEGVERPEPIAPQALSFTYKVAKISLTIKGDNKTVGATGGVGVSSGTDAGVKSVKVYATTGLYSDYTLDLLTGTPEVGSTAATEGAAIELKPVEKTSSDPEPDTKHVESVGYLVPAASGALSAGIVIEVVYDDGLSQDNSEQTYTAAINSTTLSGNADANLTNGLLAGKNYKYTLTLQKNHITFTGQVTDWEDVDAGTDIPME